MKTTECNKNILQLVHWKSLYPLRVTQQSWLRRLCLALVGPALIQQFKGGGEPISGREVTADEQPLTPTGIQYQEHQSWAHMSITTASLSLSLSLTFLSPWHCRGEYWIQQALCSPPHSVFTELCTMLRWERERQCVRERGQVKESQRESERASVLQRVIEEKTRKRACVWDRRVYCNSDWRSGLRRFNPQETLWDILKVWAHFCINNLF